MFNASTLTESPILPSELILRIFDHLDPSSGDDRPTLAQCALISADYRHDAQKRLFSSVSLAYIITVDSSLEQRHGNRTAWDTIQSHSFLPAITGSPILRTFVRRLDIQLGWIRNSPYSSPRFKPHTSQSQSLPVILSYMTNLESLNWNTSRGICWHHLARVLRSSVEDMFLTNNPREIHLTGMTLIPLPILCLSSSLKGLTIEDPNYDDTKPFQDHVHPPRSIELTTFNTCIFPYRLRAIVLFLQTPECPITLSKLQSLCVTMSHEPERERVLALFDMCAESLTHLEWSFNHTIFDPTPDPNIGDPVVDLSGLSKLTRLHFRARIENEWMQPYPPRARQYIQRINSPLPCLGASLTSLPSTLTPSLSLIISLELVGFSLVAIDAAPWSLLVDGLQIPYREYKSLNVSLTFTDDSLPEAILEPDLAQKRIDLLKENLYLKKLGDALFFIA